MATPTTKTNIYKVAFSQLDFGTNIREEYDGIAELAKSIEQNGVRVPLKGYKDGDKFVVVAGHRRFKAMEKIFNESGHDTIVPFMPMEKGTSEDDIVIEMIIENEGEPLKPLELANAILQLIKSESGWTMDLIAQRLGKSKMYISELKRLAELPDSVKKLIKNGRLSATLVRQMMKDKTLDSFLAKFEENGDDALETVDTEVVPSKTVKGKITAKEIKLNSMKELKRFAKNFSELFPNDAKREAYEMITSIMRNEATYDDILNFFTDEKTRVHDTPVKKAARKNAGKGAKKRDTSRTILYKSKS